MNYDKIILYMHAGSGNHGCEAIVNTLCHMLSAPVLTVTNSVREDETYSLRELCELAGENRIAGHRLTHVLYYLWRLIAGDPESFLRYRFRVISGRNAVPLAVSVGGDNYCYENMLKDLMLANSMLNRQGTKTILFGCSIEPELLKRPDVREDLDRYRLIIARESVTYQAILQAGIAPDKLRLYPDPAFTLGTKELPLPEGFAPGNIVGVNLSPMIQGEESRPGITMENYRELLRYLIARTDSRIALIPHVVWDRSDDNRPLRQLYEEFRSTGRVALIGDCGCEELKGYISRCRLFVGARTHATIAAYSSRVPTLVVGYSVKAKGIAVDLFGSWENYVLPVQQLDRPEELTQAFLWLSGREAAVRDRLEERMPAYIEQAYRAGREVDKIWDELNMRPGI